MLAEGRDDPNSIPTFEQFCSDMNEVSSKHCLYHYLCCCIYREKKEICLLHRPLYSGYDNRIPWSSENPCVSSFVFTGCKVRVIRLVLWWNLGKQKGKTILSFVFLIIFDTILYCVSVVLLPLQQHCGIIIIISNHRLSPTLLYWQISIACDAQ